MKNKQTYANVGAQSSTIGKESRIQAKDLSLMSWPNFIQKKSNIFAYLILLLLCFCLYFVGLGSFPIIDPSEGYYAEASREMLELGDYITPHLNYQIYFSKPILNFWLIAASYNLLGLSELSARLPFALLSTLLVLATAWYGRKVISLRAGFIGAFCLATSPLLILVSRKSSIDIAFSFFVDMAVFATALTLSMRTKWAWLVVYISLALAVLTKGPAAILLFSLGIIAFLTLARPSFSLLLSWIKTIRPFIGMAIFLAVVIPWSTAVSLATDGLFLKVFLWYENLARLQGHTNLAKVNYWFYLATLTYAFFPWVLLLVPALNMSLLGSDELSSREKEHRHTIGAKLFSFLHSIHLRALSDSKGCFLLLLASFSLTTIAFFSASKTQLATYILPAIAPMSLLVGVLIDRWISAGYVNLCQSSRNWLLFFAWAFAILGLAAGCGGITLSMLWFSQSWIDRLLLAVAALVLLTGSIKQLMPIIQLKVTQQDGLILNSFMCTAITIAAVLAIGTPLAFNLAITKLDGGLKQIALHARKSQDKLAMYGLFMPSTMFYSHKPVNTFFHGHQLVKVRKSPNGVYPNITQSIIVRNDGLKRLQASIPCRLQLVEQGSNWGWYRTPGYEVESVRSLEDSFRNPATFKIIIDGKVPTGPLTVPFAAGRLYGTQVTVRKR